MKCISDIELMEFIADKLTPAQKEQVQKHLASCDKCTKRFQDASRLWNTLGRWKVDTTAHNIADRVVASIEKSVSDDKQSKKPYIVKRVFWVDVLRIAASIIIAISAGQILGKIGTKRKTPSVVTSQTEPKYIAALGLEWSSDFAWLIMEDDSFRQDYE